MPTYQYQCTQCGSGLEAVQKFSDAALTECPECGGKLRKIFSAVGVVFKGSGFYRTDSRSSSSSSISSSGSSSSSSSSAGSSSTGSSSSSSSSTGSSSSSSGSAGSAA
ncbi:FmdB family zinc ribbon protein [Streptacidiphilus fuscans]|uniref:FmdB family transcriptional regulator n=1 Tax=Streptacidiphilus fuscans TaxID=2789292 RepID=A0A931FH87_9ACTN|nr:FmdB family zinc ribbon protein [Streptacidiphilus fuscans]MBF9071601.1 FmdB family transcriptional regulator [Streptacidiphilus fuscans]MBF9072912.1 FmdB family transcriptional regulator [Streptacidiphilus fuscans]